MRRGQIRGNHAGSAAAQLTLDSVSNCYGNGNDVGI